MVRRVKNSVEFIYCACGCGKTRPKKDNKWRLRKFIHGHNITFIKFPDQPKGKDHHSWKGGITYSHGYKLLKIPDHRLADAHGYVREHRLVWEEYNKACLLPWAEVHHFNKIKDDNRIENLLAMMNGEHSVIHNLKDMSNRVCELCKSKYTYIMSSGHIRWFRNPETKKWICRKCYRRIKEY